MMRKALTVAFAVVAMASFGMPAALAQSPLTAGSLAGRAVDAAGRGVAGQRVELVRGTQIVNVATTNSGGEWSFRDVVAGDYIVRMNVRGKVAGVRLTVGVGQALAGTLIVVPTATVSAQLGTLASLISSLGVTAGAAVTSTAFAQSVDTETTVVDPDILVTILGQLTAQQRVAFAEALLESVRDTPNNPYQQYTQQLNTIVNSGGNTVPTFPPPAAVS